jgi:hypothetical protein
LAIPTFEELVMRRGGMDSPINFSFEPVPVSLPIKTVVVRLF